VPQTIGKTHADFVTFLAVPQKTDIRAKCSIGKSGLTAAILRPTPLNKSSGGKEKLGKITKQGDRYIRKLLVVGMTSRAVMAKRSPEKSICGQPKSFPTNRSGWQQSRWQTRQHVPSGRC